MKNNKGYYSWIHAMKNAAMESHFKGKQMINEEKARRGQFNPDDFGPNKPVDHGKPQIDPKVVRAAAQVLAKEPTTPHSIELAGGDAGEYAKIRREKHAEKLASMPKAQDVKPVEFDVDGDDDVDADDTVTFRNTIDTSRRPPSFNWAHSPEEETEEEMAERHAHMEKEYEAQEDARHEGIEGIIDRIMRGKK